MGKSCTQCGSVLEQADQLFCQNCGIEVSKSDDPPTTKESTSSPATKKKNIKIWGVVAAAVVVLFIVIFGGQDDLKKASTRDLYEQFDRLVNKGENYQAALVLRELCHRGTYSNIKEEGLLAMSCKLVLSVGPDDVIFGQGDGSNPDNGESNNIDFRGMVRLK